MLQAIVNLKKYFTSKPIKLMQPPLLLGRLRAMCPAHLVGQVRKLLASGEAIICICMYYTLT
jgi:hypothetical protein